MINENLSQAFASNWNNVSEAFAAFQQQRQTPMKSGVCFLLEVYTLPPKEFKKGWDSCTGE